MKRSSFDLADLAIPEDVQPTSRWTRQMLEMAAHIGPYATLRFVEAYGGQHIYIPIDAAKNRAAEVIGDAAAAVLSKVYGSERYPVPVARQALNEARRSGVIAAIRKGQMTIGQAVPILHTSRTHLSFLINHTTEGTDRPPVALPEPKRDPRQIEMFDTGE